MSQKTINTIFYFGVIVLGVPLALTVLGVYGETIFAILWYGLQWNKDASLFLALGSTVIIGVVSVILTVFRCAEGKFPWEG